ncbi:MAG: hypothetical protein HQM11_13795 [SAR324 cluster bacterium]|nr:hypothetical protein [SAR324 cluster bacterium]
MGKIFIDQKLFRIAIAFCCAIIPVFTGNYLLFAQEQSESIPPKVYTIAYFESGPLSNYKALLQVIFYGLMEEGWLTRTKIPKLGNPVDTQALWKWASANLSNEKIRFAPDFFYSSQWKEEQKQQEIKKIEALSQSTQKPDLLIVMGPEAALALTNTDPQIPLLVLESPHARNLGIVKGNNFSERDNVFSLDLGAFTAKKVTFFHDLYKFKTMGMIYEDSPTGRISAGLKEIEDVSLEYGFRIVPCHIPNATIHITLAKTKMYDCVLELASKEIQSMYFTEHRGIAIDNIGSLVNILHKQGIPTFSDQGSELVKYGVLMTLEPYRPIELGGIYAKIIIQAIDGVPLRNISQQYDFHEIIALNRAVSETYDFEIPFDVLSIADTIYRTILQP